jgi:hypothetical protein
MRIKKILDKIYTKADQIEALHHKASLLCDDIKNLATDLEFTDKKTKTKTKSEYGKWKGNL